MNTREPHDILPMGEVPPQKDHQYVELTEAEEAELKDKTPAERAAWMREHMPTAEVLARWLERNGLPELGARARKYEFDDYRSPHATPQVNLVSAIRSSSLDPQQKQALSRAIIDGAFDAQKWESDAWAASQDGKETFRQLLAKDAATLREKRTEDGDKGVRTDYGLNPKQ